MSAFSTLLSSLDKDAVPSQPKPAVQRPKPTTQTSTKPSGSSDRFALTPNNGAAGVKRKAEDLPTRPDDAAPTRPTPVGGRFQLTAKGKPAEKPTSVAPKPMASASNLARLQRPITALTPKAVPSGSSNSPLAASNAATPSTASSKKGFAAVLEKAKAAQAAAAAATAGGIKHKPMEKMTRKERLKMMEEHKAQKKAGAKPTVTDGNRSVTTLASSSAAAAAKNAPKSGYQGTMKRAAAAEAAYKGTMRPVGAGGAKPKPKESQRRANEYVDWSDLDEEPDDYGDEDEYESDVSDDMEGGFDAMQEEEELALRAAKKEDMEAMREEERLKQEKLARKRKLQELSKSAAAKKRF